MNELRRVLRAAFASSEPTILATVVETSGTAYRRAGARLLLAREGWVAGAISGGCIESDLLESAWEKTEAGPALLAFDTRSDSDILWGYGMGCPGIVHVLVERFDPASEWQTVHRHLEVRQPFTLATSLEGATLGRKTIDAALTGKAFRETFLPGPRIAIFGAGNDAMPLARMAREIGWFVTVVDQRPAYPTAERFPDVDEWRVLTPAGVAAELALDAQTFAVVMTHNYLHDRELLPLLFASPVPYVGLLSSSKRVERLLADLQIERPGKLFAPIGLRVGAEGPEEIALAILAEMQGVCASQRPPVEAACAPLA